MKLTDLSKFTVCTYGGSDGAIPVTHHCWLCGEQHTIPQNEWIVLIRKRRFSKRQDLRMVCEASLEKVDVRPEFPTKKVQNSHENHTENEN